MAKVDRLLNLVAALRESPTPLTAEELRERVPGYGDSADESFRRTFERDKDELREIGIPVETVLVEHVQPPKAAYRIPKDRYELPDPGLTPAELAALHLAATAVQLVGIEGDEAEDALRKLGGVGGAGGAGAVPVGTVPVPAALPTLLDAVLERRPVEFRYLDDVRHLQPHRLQYERGRWYCSGHDVDRDDRRSFRVDRISGEVSAGEPGSFDRPAEPSTVRLKPWEFGDGPGVAVRVLLDATVASSVLAEDRDLTVVEERPDGAVVVELEVRNPPGLRSFLLSFGDHAELLSPQHLRDDLVSWLRAIVAKGSSSATGGAVA